MSSCKLIINEAIHTLSTGQKALWFANHISPDNCAFNINLAWHIRGEFDPCVLKNALKSLAAIHPILRTTYFMNDDGELYQKLHADIPLKFEDMDCEGFSDGFLNEMIKEETYRPIHLERGPVSRWKLFYRGRQDVILFFSIHHIAADYASIVMMMEDLCALFNQGRPNDPEQSRLEFRYADFVKTGFEELNGMKRKMQIDYWKNQLKGHLPVLSIYTDNPRPSVKTCRGDQYTIQIPDALNSEVLSISKKMGISPYTFFLSAYSILLHRYSYQDTVLIASPMSARTGPYKDVAGYFANPVVLRSDTADHPALALFLKQMHKTVMSALIHKDLPFRDLVDMLDTPRDPSRTPIAQATFNWIDYDAFQKGKSLRVDISNEGKIQWHMGRMMWDQVDLRGQTDDFDLVLEIFRAGGKALIHWQYNESLFLKSTMEGMAQAYLTLLQSMIQFPDRPVTRLPLLSAHEIRQSVRNSKKRQTSSGKKVTAHQWFEHQARLRPRALALIDGHDEITYGQLNARANQVAHYLKDLGVCAEMRVGVCMDRKAITIACLMGILKAGAAYVPLDPQYPKDRLDYMVKDAGICLLMTQKKYGKHFLHHPKSIMIMEDILEDLTSRPTADLSLDVKSSHMAYVIYTSGTTGKPKGVIIEHGSVSSLIYSYAKVFSKKQLSGVLAATSMNFDPSVADIFGTLGLGGTLILIEDPLMLAALPGRDKITLISAAPSLIRALYELHAIPCSVTVIGMGGEPLKQELVKALYSLSHIEKVYNFYGPTEETVCATFSLVNPLAGHAPRLGAPMAKTTVYILDQDMQPVPAGVPGELYLGGPGLAREYLNHPELTRERFIPHPFSRYKNQRLFKTGDLVRRLACGDIDFLGRVDNQVKIRGFRIELEEIESVISQHPDVKESAVAVSVEPSGDNMLMAYVVLEPESRVSEKDIREFIKIKLPSYMVPAHINRMEKMPLSPNGKIDRKALPRQPMKNDQINGKIDQKSQTPTIKTVTGIWEDVLKISGIDVHDNFFDLGGHSLLMVSVFAKLKQQFDRKLSLVDLYRYPTIDSLAGFLDRIDEKTTLIVKTNDIPFSSAEQNKRKKTSKIAIIGMACRFPGAANKDEFWQNIKNGVESISDFSIEELLENGTPLTLIHHKHFIPRSGWLENIDLFDADFFNVTPMEAKIMDPQHRIFMECVWEALEDAAIDLNRTDQTIGIYAGCGQNAYFANNLSRHGKLRDQMGDFNLMIGNSSDFLISRIGYKLDLKGPMTTIQTACSTSMTGVHMACQGLMNGDCDIALAGGISLGNLKKGYLYQEGMILSANGQCRPFDRNASGTIPSQGVGLVVLKRLPDAIHEKRNVYAIIAGSAINNDGIGKAGFTAPSVSGQANVIRSAQINAGVDPSQISFIEAHGTATNVGDPIETAALETIFSSCRLKENSCAVGAVKANIGHTDTASGVAGIIKTALAVKHKMLPPSIHYEQPNSHIKFSNPPFYINTKLKPWITDKLPRRAGVSSFGLGGSNAHTILEEYKEQGSLDMEKPGWQLLPISAKTGTALMAALRNLKAHLSIKSHESLADTAYTLQKGRKNFHFRTFVVANSNTHAVEQLHALSETGRWNKVHENTGLPVVFMFTGQGSQYINMGKDLYLKEPFFKKQVDMCLDIISRINPEIFNMFNQGKNIFDTDALSETEITQPALFVLEYALAKQLIHWGIVPDAMIGHSLGEYAAAAIGKIFSLEDALRAVVQRGKLIQALPYGEMLSIGLSEEKVKDLLFGRLCVAAVNTPSRTVVSGESQEMGKLRGICKGMNIPAIPLKVSHAFHSRMLDKILEKYRNVLGTLSLRPPEIPMISNLTGTWMTPSQATDPFYWVMQMRNPVRFSDGISTLMSHFSKMALVEIGPGRTLSSLARQNINKKDNHPVFSTVRASQELIDDQAFLLNAVGQLWENGLIPVWDRFHQGNPGYVSLPTYPFERKRYWIDEPAGAKLIDNPPESKLADMPARKFSNAVEKTIVRTWENFLGMDNLSVRDDFFKLGGDSLLAVAMLEKLREKFDIDLSANILITCSTIEQLARHIRGQLALKSSKKKSNAGSGGHPYIVELKKGCLPPALFLCHPGAGHLYFYSDFAHSLDIPNVIFGIEARGLHGEDRPLQSIEEIAAHHVANILNIQKKGPFWLGGASLGGMVAYEAAQQLLRRGHEVEFVLMADTPGPGHMVPPVKSNARILCQLFSDGLSVRKNLEEELLRFEDDPKRQIEWINEKYRSEGKTAPAQEGISEGIVNMIRIHVNAMRSYKPEPIESFLMFFRAGEALEDYDNHAEMAWLPLAKKGANVYTVPGNHITMNSAPHVYVMARQMMRHIKDLVNINP